MTPDSLHCEPVTFIGRSPTRWLVCLHGLFGAGRNWATLARRLVERRSDWGVLLVDLRGHGRSPVLTPPHTIAAAAADLQRLVVAQGWRPAAVLGHSFGGKVALAFAHSGRVDLEQVWVIDAAPQPATPGGSAWRMLSLLRDAPRAFGRREELVSLLQQRGESAAVATWMATNLQHVDGRYAWRIDLQVMEELLLDYFATDAWSAVEAIAGGGMTVRFVRALQSGVLDTQACQRIAGLGQTTGRVHLHPLAGGHWLNVENRDGLVGLLETHL